METIELVNDGTGLGFGIVGGKTTGVIVKTILPGGIADQVMGLKHGVNVVLLVSLRVCFPLSKTSSPIGWAPAQWRPHPEDW